MGVKQMEVFMDNFLNPQQTVVNQQTGVVQNPQLQGVSVANQPQLQQSTPANNVQVNQPALFTQEQLNSIISGRIAPLNQKVSDLTSQLQQAQAVANGYLNELTGYKQRDVVNKAGVPAQFVDFVVFEANKLAVNGKSFEDAVKEYTDTNKQLFVAPQATNQGVVGQTPDQPAPTQNNAGSAQIGQMQNNPVANNQVFTNPVGVNPVGVNPVGVNPVGASPVGASPVAYNGNQGVVTSTGVVGSTGYQFATNPQSTNNIESDVTAFLKSKGVGKQ